MSFGKRLDESLDYSEEIRFKERNKRVINELIKQTHFSRTEVERMCLIFYKMIKASKPNAKGITRRQLENFLQCTLNITTTNLIMVGIIEVIDKGGNAYLPMPDWVRVCSLFLKGTLEEKIAFVFSCYHATQCIAEPMLVKTGILALLKESFCMEDEEHNEEEDKIKDLVDLIIKRMDCDGDGKISFNDFRQSVLDDPLLLECLGPVLPDRLAKFSFQTTITHRIDPF